MKKFPERLREQREQRGYTQAYVADRIGVHFSTYAHYESGRREPNIETIVKILLVLNCSADYLLGVSNDSSLIE